MAAPSQLKITHQGQVLFPDFPVEEYKRRVARLREEMGRQGNLGSSYRLMFNPQSQTLMPMAVPSLSTAKDGIVDEY